MNEKISKEPDQNDAVITESDLKHFEHWRRNIAGYTSHYYGYWCSDILHSRLTGIITMQWFHNRDIWVSLDSKSQQTVRWFHCRSVC